jgi:hypothetical protein
MPCILEYLWPSLEHIQCTSAPCSFQWASSWTQYLPGSGWSVILNLHVWGLIKCTETGLISQIHFTEQECGCSESIVACYGITWRSYSRFHCATHSRSVFKLILFLWCVDVTMSESTEQCICITCVGKMAVNTYKLIFTVATMSQAYVFEWIHCFREGRMPVKSDKHP